MTLRLGYMQSFLLKVECFTIFASKREEAGFALASWVEKATLSAGTLPPTASQLREDVHPTQKPSAQVEPAGVGQAVPANAGIEPVLRDEPRR